MRYWMLLIFFSQSVHAVDSKSVSLPPFELTTMVSLWREQSTLSKTEGTKYPIGTLNSAIRFGFRQFIRSSVFFVSSGILLGQSENSSEIETFSYFQKSVPLIGVDAAIGGLLLNQPSVQIGLVFGAIYRSIRHAVPNDNYQFSTAQRTLPLVSLELGWQVTPKMSFRETIGMSTGVQDTFWSFGFSYSWSPRVL